MISVVVPSQQGSPLQSTIDSLLQNPQHQIIAVLDGYWPNPALEFSESDTKRVMQIHFGKSRGIDEAIKAGVAFARGECIVHRMESVGSDLSILFMTANNLPEGWTKFHRKVLEEAAGRHPIITVSRKPVDLGTNLIDDKPQCLSNLYFQILRAAKVATTEFVAIAEADCLYHSSHFTFFRPKPDEFAYDQTRFSLFTWGEPTYNWRNRKSNCTLIAPRLLLIEALEERFAKWPDGTPEKMTGEVGRKMVEKNLGITIRKSVEEFNTTAVIMINHDNASEERQRIHRKRLGPIRAFDIPHWGKAIDIISHFK